MTTFNPQNSTLKVFTFREGMLSPVGHDLCLSVDSFEVTREDDGSISGWADPTSIHVLGAWNGTDVEPVSPADQKRIESKMQKDLFSKIGKVHLAGSIAEITAKFGGKSAVGSVEGRGTTLKTSISMREAGLKPVTAFFGALKVTDRIEVQFESDLLDALEV